MFPNNPVQKLELLTERQRDVLRLFCDHLTYKEIGEQLFISKNTVKTHMGNIYLRLGLDELPDSRRKQAIHQVYCQALRGFVPLRIAPEEPEKPEEPEDVPDYIKDMVERDEKAIIPLPPGQIIHIKSKKEEPPRRCRWIVLGIILGIVLTSGCGYLVWRIYEWLNPPPVVSLEIEQPVTPVGLEQTLEAMLTETVAQMLPGASPTTDFRDDMVIMTDTPASTPTWTPTSTPTNTSIPALEVPPDGILFYDDFEQAFDESKYQVLFGTPITTDGKLTGLDSKITLLFGDIRWQNYKIEVHVVRPSSSYAQNSFIGVRALDAANMIQHRFYAFEGQSHILKDNTRTQIPNSAWKTGGRYLSELYITITAVNNRYDTNIYSSNQYNYNMSFYIDGFAHGMCFLELAKGTQVEELSVTYLESGSP